MKNSIISLIFSFVTLLPLKAQIQKEFVRDNQLWISYFSQHRFSDKIGLWIDASYRRKNNFLNDDHQTVVRPGVIFYILKDIRASLGYAYFVHYPIFPRKIPFPEHRIWEQFQWSQDINRLYLRHMLRLEHRFRRKYIDNENLDDIYFFNHRLRYNLSISIPLNSKVLDSKTWFLFIGDEIFLNFGKEIIYNYFDQNRFNVGIGYQFNKNTSLQIGYMHLFQQQNKGNVFNINHNIRFTLMQNFDWRKS